MRNIILVLAAAGVQAATILKNPTQIAKRLNYFRAMCNLRTSVEGDGIHARNKERRITTMYKYKQYLLRDCNRASTKEKKLICIEGNVPLKTGRINYISYKGKRKQVNVCNRLIRVKGCYRMCKAFFEFYPEPTRKTCKYVKRSWKRECNLRVDLI